MSSGSVRKAGSLLALTLIAAYALFAGPAVTAAAAPVSAEGSGAEGSASPGGREPEIVFQGNAEKSDAVLRRAAAQELAEFEKTQRPADIDDAAFQMQLAYRRDGYAFARVEYQITSEQDRTQVMFMISEGRRTRLAEIRITGNEIVDRETLMPFFRPHRGALAGWRAMPFVRTDIEAALAGIRNFYLGRGYLDVSIAEPQFEFSADLQRVDIAVQIHEGVRYEVRRLDFHGDIPAGARGHLEDVRRETVGQAYIGRTKLAVKSRVIEILGNLGYADAVVDVNERPAGSPGQLGLDVAISPGSLIIVDAVHIRGNVQTREEFIHRRLKLEPGEPYSLSLEKESFRELYRSGIFSKVDIDLEGAAGDRRLLVVEVEESPSQELFFEPGYGSYEQLRLKTGYRQKNLFGTGRSWASEIAGSLKAQSLSSTITDPWFLETDLRADLTGFGGRREEPSFTRKDLGGNFFLTKELSAHFSTTGGVTFRRTDQSDLGQVAEEEDLEDDYDLSSVKLQTTYDTRNDLFFPTAGQRTFLAVEHADTKLGGDVTFTRLTAGARAFFHLAQGTVLGFRYSTGMILPGEAEFTIPLAERFFNGGESTVRSFKESKLGPRDGSGKAAGGLGYNVVSAELRQRLVGNFAASLFADFGNVAPNHTREQEGEPPYRNRSQIIRDTWDDFFRGFRPAVGFGVQYLLPVGPARVDIAFNPDRDTTEDEDLYVIHFSVGMAF